MQSVFPYLLSWTLIIPFILRLAGGWYFFKFGYDGLTHEWQHKIKFFESIGFKPYKLFAYGLVILELVGGIMLLMGLLTQIVALVLCVIALVGGLIKKKGSSKVHKNVDVYFLLAIIMLTLVISGAGYYGMDLPI